MTKIKELHSNRESLQFSIVYYLKCSEGHVEAPQRHDNPESY